MAFLTNINHLFVADTASLSETLSINAFVQNLLLNLGGSSFTVFVKILTLWLGVAWLLAVIWVVKDALQRYNNLVMPILWLLIVLPFNLLGLLAYVILRPVEYANDQLQEELGLKLYKAELSRFVECPACGNINSREHMFCTECGLKLTAACSSCNKQVWIDWAYCAHCGIKLPDEVFGLENSDKNEELETQNTSRAWNLADVFDYIYLPDINFTQIFSSSGNFVKLVVQKVTNSIFLVHKLLVMYVVNIVKGIWVTSSWVTNAFLIVFKSFWDAIFIIAGWIITIIFGPFKFIYYKVNSFLSVTEGKSKKKKQSRKKFKQKKTSNKTKKQTHKKGRKRTK